MKASLSKKIHEVYTEPLPYVLRPLPPLILHNPVSVLYYLYKVFSTPNPEQVQIKGILDLTDPTRSVRVSDPDQMSRLWSMGFFGKGSLSRSEPSWFGRTARRLGFDGGELTFEELTELRRQKRRQFKKERDEQEKNELARRKEQESGGSQQRDLWGPTDLTTRGDLVSETDEMLPPRQEDLDLIIGDTINKLEHLQLTPSEAVFLSFGLGVLDISVSGRHDTRVGADFRLLSFLCDGKLFTQYVAYHYFRSLGWCARSGIKFGTDLILYTRGPPFQHAEFAVMVLHANHDEEREWYWAQSIGRVVGGVKKTLVFAYVSGPNPATINWSHINSTAKFENLLKQYSVQTVLHSRWAPTRTRD